MNARPPQPSPYDARRIWRTAVSAAVETCASGDTMRLVGALRTAKASAFPVEGASAKALSDAFLLQGQALIDAGTDWRRELARRALMASADALDGLMIDEAAAGLRDLTGGD